MARALGVCVALLSLVWSPAAVGRTWTDSQGKQVNANFVRVHEGNVVLSQGSRVITVPLANLSSEDQQYIRRRMNGGGEEDSAPVGLPRRSSRSDRPPALRRLGSPPEETTEPGGGADFWSSEPSPVAEEQPATRFDPGSPPMGGYGDPGEGPMAAQPIRSWTDIQGNQIEAQFVKLAGDMVVLRRNGNENAYPLAGFSPADQDYIRSMILQGGGSDMLPDGSPLASPADAGGYGAPAEMEMPSSPWGGMAGGSSDAYQPEGGPGYRAEDYQQGYGEDSQSSPPDDAYAGSRESDAPEKQARHQDHSPVEYDASGPGTYGSGSAPPAGSPPPGYASSYEGPDSGEHQGSAGYPEESGGGYSGSPQVTQEMVYYCTNCNKELPDHIDVGDRCPHCRAYLSYEEGPDGTVTKRSARGFYTGLVNLVVGVVLLISAVGGLMRLIRR